MWERDDDFLAFPIITISCVRLICTHTHTHPPLIERNKRQMMTTHNLANKERKKWMNYFVQTILWQVVLVALSQFAQKHFGWGNCFQNRHLLKKNENFVHLFLKHLLSSALLSKAVKQKVQRTWKGKLIYCLVKLWNHRDLGLASWLWCFFFQNNNLGNLGAFIRLFGVPRGFLTTISSLNGYRLWDGLLAGTDQEKGKYLAPESRWTSPH